MSEMKFCTLCPRNCKVNRENKTGFCSAPKNAHLAKVMLHQWEEPCICYGAGSGALFFSGCQLKCTFCQNHEISQNITGKSLSENDLYDLFFMLEEKGACNINLVSPTPYFNTLIPSMEKARAKGLSIPFVLNSGGYESMETLKRLEGLVDIYLPDFKFFDTALSEKLCRAKDYAEKCIPALMEMQRQTGNPVFSEEKLQNGVMIRHLVLPGQTKDSIKILGKINELFDTDGVVLSLLRQYTPCHLAKEMPGFNRTLTSLEYQKVEKKAEEIGFTYLYTQKKESAREDFIPDFTVFSREKN